MIDTDRLKQAVNDLNQSYERSKGARMDKIQKDSKWYAIREFWAIVAMWPYWLVAILFLWSFVTGRLSNG